MPIEAKASCNRFNASLCVIGLVMVWIHDTKSPGKKKTPAPNHIRAGVGKIPVGFFVGWVCLVPLPHLAILFGPRKHLGVPAR